MSKRVFREVNLHYRLASPGSVSPDTQTKRWFFELPSKRDNEKDWHELLHRIFYNHNGAMQAREPDDQSWLSLDSFEVSEVDIDACLDWDGKRNSDSGAKCLPWCFISTVWEFSVSWYVNDEGQYDGLDGNSYTELVAYRSLAAGVAESRVKSLVKYLFPGRLSSIWGDRDKRLANIDCVRDPVPYRVFRQPGEEPQVSGPVT